MDGPSREAGFLFVTDVDGIRHAIRLSTIAGLRDADTDRSEALIMVNGGRAVILAAHDFDTLVAEIAG